MKVLAIGNSFSEDAVYYLRDIADAAGEDIFVVNLYIGGCPLEEHWLNIESNAPSYQYQVNGAHTDRLVSIPEVLVEEPWDVIVTQQASGFSGWIESYEPFLGLMQAYIQEKAPKARRMLHKTWAYDEGSTHRHFLRYHRSQQEMYACLSRCYAAMAEKYRLPLIPSGDVIQRLRSLPPFDRKQGGRSLCRDGFHMDYLYGRYALSYTWARVLLGRSLEANAYVPQTELTDETAEESVLELIRQTAEEVVGGAESAGR